MDTTDLESNWECENCGDEMTSSSVIEIENKVANQMRDAMNLTVEHLEEELLEITGCLHPNHYLLLLAQKHLIGAYGIDLNKQPTEKLIRRQQLCNNVRNIP